MFDELYSAISKEILTTINRIKYRRLEYNCRTNLSDEEMIKMQIDWALENNDKEKFIELSQQLKEMAIYD